MRFIRRIPASVDLRIQVIVIPIRRGVRNEDGVKSFYERHGCEITDARLQRDGIPDFEGRRADGSTFRIEVKRPGDGLSPEQVSWRLDHLDEEYVLAYAVESV